MAKEGKKLELYEILAAKRAKGKMPQVVGEPKPGRETRDNPTVALPETLRVAEPLPPPPVPAPAQSEKLVIIDAALDAERPSAAGESGFRRREAVQPAASGTAEEPARPKRGRSASLPADAVDARPVARERAAPAEPRARKPREVAIQLDTAFIIFVIAAAFVGSSYFLGYKRGQEERPAGLVGLGDIENVGAEHVNLRHLSPAARTTVIPPDQDYTLVLRTEPATEDLSERLEYELAEAIAKGGQQFGSPVQGFIFLNSTGNDARFVLAVGLAKTPNDADLNRLMQIYNSMEGITLSREPRPYIGCQIAPIRELGRLVE